MRDLIHGLLALPLLGLMALPVHAYSEPAHSEPARAAGRLELPAQATVSLSPFEGWTVSLGAPIVLDGGTGLPSVGVSVNRHFPVGQALGWGGWAERLGIGLGANAFAPLNFQQLYFGASLGLGHSTPLGEHLLDYGLRYAPLLQVDFTNSSNTGYHGLLANLGLHVKIAPNTWTSFGLQGGFYLPFSGPAQPFWVLQPLAGLNLRF